VIKAAGALTVLILGVGMLILFRGERYALPQRKA